MTQLINMISLDKEIWEFIRKKRNEFEEKIDKKEIEGKILKTRYQGSVATKTIINPLIKVGKNSLDLDVVIVLQGSYLSEENNKTAKSIENWLRDSFKENINKEEKALKISYVEKKINGEEIKLSMDVVIMFEIDGNTHVWDNEYKIISHSDSFSLIDKFNSLSANNSSLRDNVKIIKALRDAKKIKGLKSIHILNSIVKAAKNSKFKLCEVIYFLEIEVNELALNGYTLSATNNYDKLIKSIDFNYSEIIGFVNELKEICDDEYVMKRIISKAIDGKYHQVNNNKKVVPVYGYHELIK